MTAVARAPARPAAARRGGGRGRSWPVVEAALGASAPPAARAPAARGAPARARGRARRRAARGGAVPGRRGGGRLDRRPLRARGPGRGAARFAALPKGGPVLAISRSGRLRGPARRSSRRLGSFSQAGWSPRGLHVVGVEGRRLVAVTPAGTMKWTLARPRARARPGLEHRRRLRGGVPRGRDAARGRRERRSGDGPRGGRRAAAVTPAWRPHSDRVLTYARRAARSRRSTSSAAACSGARPARLRRDAHARSPGLPRRPARRTLVTLRHGPGSTRSRPPHDRAPGRRSRARAAPVRPERDGRRAANSVLEILPDGRARVLFQGDVDGARVVRGRAPAAPRVARRGPVAPHRARAGASARCTG